MAAGNQRSLVVTSQSSVRLRDRRFLLDLAARLRRHQRKSQLDDLHSKNAVHCSRNLRIAIGRPVKL